ncbi:unnamed protein product [Cuscuta europaea]|uniref:Cyclin-like domain-containing protein n=1 Tax=Cuscuta europaea TaxID=41803 RepID=A0A9P0YZN6_CUSEU|nr:unnamed protein product [Cuscuta europaea]
MDFAGMYSTKGDTLHSQCRSSHGRNHHNDYNTSPAADSFNTTKYFSDIFPHQGDLALQSNLNEKIRDYSYNYNDSSVKPVVEPSCKRIKCSSPSRGRYHQQQHHAHNNFPSRQPFLNSIVHKRNQGVYDTATTICNKSSTISFSNGSYNDKPCSNGYASNTHKRSRSEFEDSDIEVVFMSREEIDRCSPSRKDGIDALHEMQLRYSYCAFLQTLGTRLELPHTTIGTAMVLCHRFFVHRSHASHDRFLVSTAALFLAAKSEETPCSLNTVLRSAAEIFHKQDFSYLSYILPIDWFEQYRERVIEAEQLILTTLNFELNVQHPYGSLTCTLEKLGFSQSVLVNLAMNLVSEGLRSSLWLQFKPKQIAAGAAYLAAKFLNLNMASNHFIWHEFQTPPPVLRDVAQQLMELF